MIPPTDERNVLCLPINFHCVQFCFQKVWTIAFVCGIIFHEVIESFLLSGVRGNSILSELNHFFYSFFAFGLTSIVTLQFWTDLNLRKG